MLKTIILLLLCINHGRVNDGGFNLKVLVFLLSY